MPESPEFFAERLRYEGEKTISFFSGLTSDQWHLPIYTEGEVWTVRNVLAHYVTSERGFCNIFRKIVEGGEGVAEDFDIDRYNSSQQKKTEYLSPPELISQFTLVRTEMVNLVASMSNEDLERKGRHPYLGPTTLGEMIKMVYRHNQIHFRDIRKALGEI